MSHKHSPCSVSATALKKLSVKNKQVIVHKLPFEKFYGAKRPINIWDVNVDNTVISKLVETKTNSKYLIGYLDKVIRPLVLVLPKMSGYVKTFKVKDGDNDKKKILMSFPIDNGKLLEK